MADPRVLFGYRSTRSEAHQREHPDMGWTINNSCETVANIHTEWYVDWLGELSRRSCNNGFESGCGSSSVGRATVQQTVFFRFRKD